MSEIPTEFGWKQVETVGPPEVPRDPKPPEQWAAEQEADKARHSDVLKELRWTPETFEEAQAYGFPKAIGRTLGRWTWAGGGAGSETVYSRRQIARWLTRVQVFAAKLPAKVK
jgi:hypothetical protein